MKPGAQRVYVSGSEDLACSLGDLKMALDNPEGRTVLKLKSMVVWNKVGEQWRIVANSWSMNTQ